jgi:hypothetical protein
MGYMTKRNTATHEWWKDQANGESQLAFLNSYRSAQREQSSAAWRRIAIFGVLFVAVGLVMHALGAA